MPIIGLLRLTLYYSTAPVMYLVGLILTRIPNYVRTRFKCVVLVGPAHIVRDALSVCEDFLYSSPDLFDALCAHGKITINYCPWLDRNTDYKKQFFVASESIAWGKTGLLVNLVWTAFKVKASLDKPWTSFCDFYQGSPLKRDAALQMKQWLEVHNQPIEFIQSFSQLI